MDDPATFFFFFSKKFYYGRGLIQILAIHQFIVNKNFSFLLFAAEEGNAMAAIANKPVEVANFSKHCDQRRKYPVLLRVEFQVGG